MRPEARQLGRLPRVGFLGVGWIGRNRMEALVRSGLIEAVAVADPCAANREQALALAPAMAVEDDLSGLLGHGLDGLVIATPSALHAGQAVTALRDGLAVFCQKPLGRNAAEVAAVVAAARAADCLLGVDLSYRFLAATQAIRVGLQSGQIGEVYAVDAVFHNAYGPDKSWFYDPLQSGGGCVIDLGIHLIDLVVWSLGFPRLDEICSSLFAKGVPLAGCRDVVEDYAFAHARLQGGGHLSLACSWNLPAGRDAVIGVSFYGTRGGLRLRNVNGSFYDFVAERLSGTSRTILAAPPDDWGGRAALDWAQRLGGGSGFDPHNEQLIAVAEVLDTVYGR